MDNDITNREAQAAKPPTLPATARLPINRCNLPAIVLGSLTFQRHPTRLYLDGVADLHRDLFDRLDKLYCAAVRTRHFMDYMVVKFRLESLEDAGLDKNSKGDRPKADYIRTLRGWAFDPDGREGAVMKGWVESRFGLQPRHHRGVIDDYSGDNYQHYLSARAAGLYNTNALEAQLDLLYSYSQYELFRGFPGIEHIRLYRGVNQLPRHDVLAKTNSRHLTLVLNNINSFSRSPERAGEFGDDILAIDVPLAKVVYFSTLLPKILKGEDEYVVLGGVYEAEIVEV